MTRPTKDEAFAYVAALMARDRQPYTATDAAPAADNPDVIDVIVADVNTGAQQPWNVSVYYQPDGTIYGEY